MALGQNTDLGSEPAPPVYDTLGRSGPRQDADGREQYGSEDRTSLTPSSCSPCGARYSGRVMSLADGGARSHGTGAAARSAAASLAEAAATTTHEGCAAVLRTAVHHPATQIERGVVGDLGDIRRLLRPAHRAGPRSGATEVDHLRARRAVAGRPAGRRRRPRRAAPGLRSARQHPAARLRARADQRQPRAARPQGPAAAP